MKCSVYLYVKTTFVKSWKSCICEIFKNKVYLCTIPTHVKHWITMFICVQYFHMWCNEIQCLSVYKIYTCEVLKYSVYLCTILTHVMYCFTVFICLQSLHLWKVEKAAYVRYLKAKVYLYAIPTHVRYWNAVFIYA